MATPTPQPPPPDDKESVTPYTMHVSARYLDLTRKKLELTRLPRELELPDSRRWDQGTPKSVLEPLLDFWLEGYEWRNAEAGFNSCLPQFRTSVAVPVPVQGAHSPPPLSAQRRRGKRASAAASSTSKTETETEKETLRIHFVHRRSSHTNAIPLLLCHTWPSSFIEVQRVIEGLTEPVVVPGEQVQAFHVVAPSIPGFGFSDASMKEEFGVSGTAAVFDGLMGRLGYTEGGYVAGGTGWGFSICRALALNHSNHCLAVHTSNPSFPAPRFKKSKTGYIKYRIAKLTKAKIPALSFGYTPTELSAPSGSSSSSSTTNNNDPLQLHRPLGPTLHHLYSLRPQTLAFSLCDSPVGLLAALLDVIHTREVAQDPLASRSISPFLSPVELEMQEARAVARVNGITAQTTQTTTSTYGLESVEEEAEVASESVEGVGNGVESGAGDGKEGGKGYTWSPTEVLNFVMLQWLPGPEAALRWLRRAHLDTAALQDTYSPVPLGISTFYARKTAPQNKEAGTATPLMWGSSSHNITWVKRHQQPATLPGFEAPDLLVLDLRDFVGSLLKSGKLGKLGTVGQTAQNGNASV